MAKKSYSELLRDPRWQRKRLEVLNAAEFSCEECCSTDKTLNVHHKKYRKGAMPWEYERNELISLCELCHEKRHAFEHEIGDLLAEMPIEGLELVLGYLQGRAVIGTTGVVTIRSVQYLVGLSESLGDSSFVYERLMDRYEACNHTLTAAEAEDLSQAAFMTGKL